MFYFFVTRYNFFILQFVLFRSFEIELENVSKRSYSLCISDLMASIVPEECSVKVCFALHSNILVMRIKYHLCVTYCRNEEK